MVETTADVRRDIELTRERMSSTLAQLEHKLNVVQLVRDHPWPALAAAVGVGVLLSGSDAAPEAAKATARVTRSASRPLGELLDDPLAKLITGANFALRQRLDGWVNELLTALGAQQNQSAAGVSARGGFGTGPAHDNTMGMPAQAPARAD
jgi:hypothetical protein